LKIKIKGDKLYKDISTAVYRQLKKEVEECLIKRNYKYCAIDANGLTCVYMQLPSSKNYGKWFGKGFCSWDTIVRPYFTPEEREYIKKNWKSLIWRLK
jgi:hypothetical protein